MIVELKYIERIIDRQSEFVKWRIFYAVFIFTIGLTILIITFFINSNDTGGSIKTLSGVGSALVLTITAWPIKEIVDKRNSIKIFKTFKLDLIHFEKRKETENDESKRIKEYVWKAVEKLAIG